MKLSSVFFIASGLFLGHFSIAYFVSGDYSMAFDETFHELVGLLIAKYLIQFGLVK